MPQSAEQSAQSGRGKMQPPTRDAIDPQRVPTVAPPPGFHQDVDGRTAAPKARVRRTRSMFGPSSTYELVAVTRLQMGDTVCVEPTLLRWDPKMKALQPPLPSDPVVVDLVQRCAAIRKMMEKAPRMAPFCEGTLPVAFDFALASYKHKKGEGPDPRQSFALPWQIKEQGGVHGGFCVLAHRGLQNSAFAKAFSNHEELHRLATICTEGAVGLPDDKLGLFRYTSCARQMESAGKSQPNCDYDINEDGELTLRTVRPVNIGDVISVPRQKTFADHVKKRAPMDVLKDKDTMKEALMAKASQKDAPEAVRNFAVTEHPRITPRLPPPGSLDIPYRAVASEAWREVLWGDPCGGGDNSRPYALYVDFLFDDKESAQLTGALCRAGREVPVPFHIGFEEHAHRVEGESFTRFARALISRAQSFMPPGLRGAEWSGTGAAGTLLRLGLGEELLRFSFDAVRAEASISEALQPSQGVALPACLCLNGTGKLCLYPPGEQEAIDVPAKAGRLIMWTPDIEHEVPMVKAGETSMMFHDMWYTKKQA